jgi:hypothetical protein
VKYIRLKEALDMTRHRASCSIAVFSALACISAAAAPRTGNPCKQIQHTLDRQIDDLKTQQKSELLQCEQGNGRGSAACLSLKDQQRQSLRAMRGDRTGQMNDCYGHPSLGAAAIHAHPNETHFDQADNHYPDNDQYPDNNPKLRKVPDPHPRHPHHPHHPASTNGAKSASSDKPSKSGDRSGDKNSRANAGSGGGGSTASAGHNHNGGSGASGGSSRSSGGGGSSGGGSYSGSSHSSGGGSSYSGGSSGSSGSSHSSGGGGGSYSGGSTSSGSSSSSSSSSSSGAAAASGGRPK